MASRLSYFFLEQHARRRAVHRGREGDQLNTPEQVAAQATRLMKDARFRETWPPSTASGWSWSALDSAEKDADGVPAVERRR